jgi:hypothetical protein
MAEDDKAGPAAGKTRLFLVETAAAPDALLRVLSVCAARQAPLASVAFRDGPDGGQVRIETTLAEADAERLSALIAALPAVRGVSVGWRSDRLVG